MGRVSTLFSIAAIALQVMLAPVIGHIAHNIGVRLAICPIAALYLFAAASGWFCGKTAGIARDLEGVVTVGADPWTIKSECGPEGRRSLYTRSPLRSTRLAFRL